MTSWLFSDEVLGWWCVRILDLARRQCTISTDMRQKSKEDMEVYLHYGNLDAIRGSVALRPPAPRLTLQSRNETANTSP